MSEPKNMHSEPRKAHIPSFRWSSPVTPMFGSSWATACASAISDALPPRAGDTRA